MLNKFKKPERFWSKPVMPKCSYTLSDLLVGLGFRNNQKQEEKNRNQNILFV